MLYYLVMKYDARNFHPGIREMEDSVNSFMNDCGFSEKMVVVTEAPILQVTVDRFLTEKEKDEYIALVNTKSDQTKMVCTALLTEAELELKRQHRGDN